MNRASGTRAALAASMALGAMAVSLPASAAAHGTAPVVTVVASGLNSPKHLTFGPGGLYVSESGTGGPAGKNCVRGTGVTGAQTTFCAGRTGSVALLTKRGPVTVLPKLPSVIEEDNQEAAGPAAMTFDCGRLAVLFQDLLVNKDGTSSAPKPAGPVLGKVLRARPFSPPRSWSAGADVAAFAAAHPQSPKTLGGLPGETTYDSDPYDIVPYRGGYVIADAAANSVLRLDRHGHLSLISRLPTVREKVPAGVLGPDPVVVHAQAVPTSIAVGPHGALYVGTLRGVPSLPGTADVYRVAKGHAPVAVVKGLTAVTSIAFDHHGRLLVLEFSTGGLLAPPSTPGALLRVGQSGHVSTLPVTGLSAPTGMAVGRDDAVYIANHGTSPGTASPSGQILKVTGLG
jgi:hypothetical protein